MTGATGLLSYRAPAMNPSFSRFHVPVLTRLLAALLLSASPLLGYSRAYLPLPAAVSQAGAIVVARVTTAPGVTAKEEPTGVNVERVIKGEVPEGALTVLAPAIRHFAGLPLAGGTRYVLFLERPHGQPEGAFIIMEDGTRLFENYKAEDVSAIATLAAQTPAWSTPANGITTVLLTEKTKHGEKAGLDLWIGCKNVSAADMEVLYNKWPLETHSFWKLEIQDESGKTIAAKAHPTVTPQEASDYFSKHGKNQEVTLAPGMCTWYRVGSVNTASPGWGYKEDLDFKFYPMPTPGKYTIRAYGHHVLSTGVVAAGPATVVLE